jgi:hypothetical protein
VATANEKARRIDAKAQQAFVVVISMSDEGGALAALGADLDGKDARGMTPLVHAAQAGQWEAADDGPMAPRA